MKLLFCILGMVGIYNAQAQSLHTIQFTDARTKTPVEGVTVQTNNTGRIWVAGADGSVQFPVVTGNNAPGIKIIYSAIGYQTDSTTVLPGTAQNILLNPQPLNLKEVTVMAPTAGIRSTNTIGKIDLKLRPLKSAQELLQLAPGLFIAQHQGGGKAEQIFLRGFDIDHGTDIAISADGIPVNMVSHAHGQGYADLHYLVPETIKDIHFGAGPYNTAQGNLSTAGHISFETRERLTENLVQAEAGSFNTLRLLTLLQLPLKNDFRHNGYVAGEYVYSNGPFNTPQHFNRFNVFTKYNRRLSNNSSLTFSASSFYSKWNASGQIPDRAVQQGLISRFGAIDDNEGGNTSRHQLSLRLNSKTANGGTLSNQLYFVRYGFDLFSNFTFFLDDPVNGDQIRQREQRNIFGYNGSYTMNRERSFAGHNTVLGWGLRADRTSGSELSHTLNRSETINNIQLGDIRETNYFLFLNHSITRGKWQLSAGSRFDGFAFGYKNRLTSSNDKQNRAIVSPKLAIDYRYRKNLLLFVKAGKGFHSNDTRVALDNTAREILPAAYGADAGFTAKPLKGMVFTASFWYLYLQQEFVYVGDAGVVEPGGSTSRKGIDMAIRYQLTPKLYTAINLNRAISKDVNEPKGANFIPLAPRFNATGSITYQNHKNFSAGLYVRHMANRPANTDYSVTAPGYTVADLGLNYRIKKWEFGISAENIFNTQWNEAQFETTSRLRNEPAPVTELHYTPGTPFAIRLKAAVRF